MAMCRLSGCSKCCEQEGICPPREMAADQPVVRAADVALPDRRFTIRSCLSSDIRNPATGDTENPATSATLMPRRVPVRVLP